MCVYLLQKPTATFERIASAAQFELDADVQKGIVQFLKNLPSFDFRTTPVDAAVADPNAFKDIPNTKKAAVKEALKELQKSVEDLGINAVPKPTVAPFDVDGRIAAVGELLSEDLKSALRSALAASNGDWESAALALNSAGALNADDVKRLELANRIGEFAANDPDVAKAIVAPFATEVPGVIPSLKEIAARFGIDDLAKLFPGADDDEKMRKAIHARRSLFEDAATEVIQKMLGNKELPLKDQRMEDGTTVSGDEVAKTLAVLIGKLAGFDIHTSDIPKSIEAAKAADPGIFGTISEVLLRLAIGNLGWLQNLVPFVRIPEVLSPLIQQAVTSAADFLGRAFNDIVNLVTEPVAPAEGEARAKEMVSSAQRVLERTAAASSTVGPQLNVLSAMLDKPVERGLLVNIVNLTGGDLAKAISIVKEKKLLPQAAIAQLESGSEISPWAGHRPDLVRKLVVDSNMKSLSDIAMSFNVDELATALPIPIVASAPSAMVPTAGIGESAPVATSAFTLAPATEVPAAIASSPATAAMTTDNRKDTAKSLLDSLWSTNRFERLFVMNRDGAFELTDSEKDGVGQVLANLVKESKKDGMLRSDSIHRLLQKDEIFHALNPIVRGKIEPILPQILNTSILGSSTEATEVLYRRGFHSSEKIALLSADVFKERFRDQSPEVQQQLLASKATAMSRKMAAENFLMRALEADPQERFTLADSPAKQAKRIEAFKELSSKYNIKIDWEALFGSQDFCECGECTSVYSASAYLVEILQFVRNNNQPSPPPADPNFLPPNVPYVHPSVIGTPLEPLLRRRPDIAELELSCANTNTTIPYMDLANEVMESFIAHQSDFIASSSTPKLSPIYEHNTLEDETNDELLAEPKHTNEVAYCKLNNAVFPFTLPYHQPIDVQREYLRSFMDTTRYDLLDRVRNPLPKYCSDWSKDRIERFKAVVAESLQRAVDAEFLSITQEEYIILTHEAFKSKEFYEIARNTKIRPNTYRKRIGVRPLAEYFGYDREELDNMLSLDEFVAPGTAKGLTFVKEEFLPRTGMSYAELVDLLRTRFVNRNQLDNWDLQIFQTIRFSYRFLMTLVVPGAISSESKYAKVIQAITDPASIPELKAAFAVDQGLKDSFRRFQKRKPPVGFIATLRELASSSYSPMDLHICSKVRLRLAHYTMMGC